MTRTPPILHAPRPGCGPRRGGGLLAVPAVDARAPPVAPPAAGRTSCSSRSTRCAPTTSAATATRRRSTPTLDALAARGVRFATAVAHVPLTGALARLDPHRPDAARPRRARQRRVRAAAERAHRRRGLRQGGLPHGGVRVGFPARTAASASTAASTRTTTTCRRATTRAARRYVERFADATTDAVAALAGRARAEGRPFFLWVHYYDPHAPYEPPARLRRAASPTRPTTARSRSSTRSSRACCGALEATGDLARTLVLVTADHGESLGEHGEEHARPLRLRRDAPRAVDRGRARRSPRAACRATVARGIDVLPTLLDYAGLARRARASRAARCGRRSRAAR